MFINILLLTIIQAIPFSEEIAKQMFNTPSLVLFYNKFQSDMIQQFNEIPADNILKIEIDVTINLNNKFAQLLKIDNYPQIKLLEFHGEQLEDLLIYSYEDQLQTQKIIKFLQKYDEGYLFPDLKSENIPQKQYEDGIAIVVGHNYDEFIQDSTRYSLMYFYDDNCDLCVSFTQNLVQLNNLIRSGKTLIKPNKFKIGKIRGEFNQIPGLSVLKYPLLLIYTPIDKDNYIVYNGDRTALGMLRYLEHMKSNEF